MKDRVDLSSCDPGKPFEEVIDRGTILEILEQGVYGHTCSPEDPGSADFFRISLNRRA